MIAVLRRLRASSMFDAQFGEYVDEPKRCGCWLEMRVWWKYWLVRRGLEMSEGYFAVSWGREMSPKERDIS